MNVNKLLTMEKKFKSHMNRILDNLFEQLSTSVEEEADILPLLADPAISQFQQSCYNEIIEMYRLDGNERMMEMIVSMRKLNSLTFRTAEKGALMTLQEPAPLSSNQFTSVVHQEEEAPVLEQENVTWKDVKDGILSRVSIIHWAPKYNLQLFSSDLIAALAVGLMIIPQGMAYALLAGVPPIYGLYTAWIPLFIYFIFGSSRELAIGPTAMVSLILPTAVGTGHVQQSEEYITIVIFYAFVYGVILLLLGTFKIGTLMENILSRPALTGFTQGASILIACSQLKNVLGYHSHVPYTVDNLLLSMFHNLHEIVVVTAVIGITAAVIILVMKKVKKTFPTIILILIVGILFSWLIDAPSHHVEIVGEVPPGLPKPQMVEGLFHSNLLTHTLGSILVLTFVGFTESVSVAKKFSAENQYNLSVNQELFALGMCNIVGSFFQAYPVAGSLPRTVVNAHTGSRTPAATAMAGIIVTLMLAFGTKLIYYTPLCILGAIVMSAALSIVDFSEPKYLWRVGKKAECISFVLSWIATAFFGPILGVATAGLLSLCQVIYHSGRPDIFEMGKIPDSQPQIWKNTLRYPRAETISGIIVVGVSAPRLSFYNFSWFRSGLDNIEAEYESKKDTLHVAISSTNGGSAPLLDNDVENSLENSIPLEEISSRAPLNEDSNSAKGPLHAIILDMTPIEQMDGTSIQYMLEMSHSYAKKGVSFLYAGCQPKVVATLRKSGIVAEGAEKSFIFKTIQDAVDFATGNKNTGETHAETLGERYPLVKLFTADYGEDSLISF
eukprot:TRINITY_DN2005_c0_g1_i2.p1 TRINITY_DN2005_c0_g1~~TRINITY_DN2005_c0_g1_i2.p1  ORF type:complete len:782 (+),score=267.87 TRINITY_DN2005_c0_g1_i2:283-2628(+)